MTFAILPTGARLMPFALALVASLGLLAACVNDETTFTQGRLQNPCGAAIPVCRVRASCVLRDDEFFRGTFPGGFRAVVHSEVESGRLVARFLLTEMLSPGTELHVLLHPPDCGNVQEEHPRDIDLFEFAGKDRIIEFHFDIEGRGDHLLEIFSDMSADYLLTLTFEETR
ncbi:MAG: hypothetical protein H0U74_23500 [Bradymonadaceae bacterium]|nr:hypothetical protein [Lujinxingiaceae bacterium]